MFKQLDRRLFTILLIIFVQILGASMILPILPLFAQREFEMSPQVITILLSMFFAAQFVAGPYLGRLSDQYGRLPVLIVSQIGTVIAFAMLAFAPSIEWLFFARILDGITGGNIIVARAYVVDVTPREKRTESLSYIFAAFGVGFILGPAAGGILAASFGIRAPYIIAAVAAFLTVILTWYVLDESISAEQKAQNRANKSNQLAWADVIRNAPLVQILIVVFIAQFGIGLLQSTFSLYGEAVLMPDFSEDAVSLGIGLLLACFGVMQVITQSVILPLLLPRLGDVRLIIFGITFRTIGMLGLAFVTSPFIAVPPILLFALGAGTMVPPLQSLATETVSDSLRGAVMGVYQSVFSFAVIVSTAIAGTLFAIRPNLPYIVGGILTIAAIIPTLPLQAFAQAIQKPPIQSNANEATA